MDQAFPTSIAESRPVKFNRVSFRNVTAPFSSHIQTSEGVVAVITRKRSSLSRSVASVFCFRARCHSNPTISSAWTRIQQRL